jgi:hypothetical protein
MLLSIFRPEIGQAAAVMEQLCPSAIFSLIRYTLGFFPVSVDPSFKIPEE